MSELTMRDYESHVTDLAGSIIDELRDRVKDGEEGESLREWLIEHLDECCDSDGWIIYTHQAQFIVCQRGTEAYTSEFGEEGLTKDGDINWSAIAYMALRSDLIEELDRQDIDMNAPEDSEAFEELRERMALETELTDAWEGEGNSERVTFDEWLAAMADNDHGTFQDSAKRLIELRKDGQS